LWIWQIGDSTIFAAPNESYSLLQTSLREHFADRAVAVINLANGSASGYLPPSDLYEKDIYQVWQTPFAKGALEKLVETAKKSVESD
jgi:hypothetical protein